MSSLRSPTKAEWEQVKKTLRQKYLINNETAPSALHYLETQLGWKTTLRIVKSRFTYWGWDKKLTKLQYGAMRCILQDFGDVDFLKPLDGGTYIMRKKAQTVKKEINRQTQAQEKNTKKPPKHVPYVTLETARAVLRESRITWIFPFESVEDALQRIDWSGFAEAEEDEFDEQTEDDNDNDGDVNDDDDNLSIASDEPMADKESVADRARILNLRNFQTQPQPAQTVEDIFEVLSINQSRILGALPYGSSLLADLHSIVFPHTPGYELRSHVDTPCYDHLGLFTHPSMRTSLDSTDHFGLAENSTIEYPDTSGQGFVIDALRSHYQVHDQNGHQRAVMRFCFYYVSHLLAGHVVADDYDHYDRQIARSVLDGMLQWQNMDLLPACFWLVSVIWSYDRPRLLLNFFEDCIECIETSSSYLATTLKPWIRFMVIEHRETFKEYSPRSHRLQQDFLENMHKTFDVFSELQQGINHLERTGNRDCNTGLILRMGQAFDLAQVDPVSGVRQLLECSHKSRAAFGARHLVTIRCEEMVASAYHDIKQQKPDLALADTHLREALMNMEPCSRILEATYYKILFERAKFVLCKRGRLDEARYDLENAFAFRLRTLGAQSPLTWEAGVELFKLMRRQGFVTEAQESEARLRHLYDKQWVEGRSEEW